MPVLDDDGTIVSDSNAILVYVARKLGRTDWLPEDAKGEAAVQRWLSVAAGELAYGPAAARLVTVFGAKFNPEEVIGRAHTLLGRLEAHLAGRDWLVGERPTIADVALYSYLARSPEGNVDLSGYANVNAYLRRIEALRASFPLSRRRPASRPPRDHACPGAPMCAPDRTGRESIMSDGLAITKSSPWHPGEKAIQRQVGVAERMEEVGRRVVRTFMPDQHRAFFAQIPFIVAAASTVGATPGRRWSPAVPGSSPRRRRQPSTSRCGRIRATRQVRACATATPSGSSGSSFHPPTQPRERHHPRRGDGVLNFAVDQSFGNCRSTFNCASRLRPRPA